eukprot:EG_transcript_25390
MHAETYLAALGIPKGLPTLALTFGKTAIAPGTQFRKTVDRFLQETPEATWDPSLGPCTLVYVDPDAPAPEGDGSGPGRMGPWLHWLVTDAVGSAASGSEAVGHMGPAPPSGNHRYTFVLFQQTAPVKHVKNDRARWNFPEFLKANPSLKPVAANFFLTAA